MADVPVRPAGVNFWGMFGTPDKATASQYVWYESWNFATQTKPQIDAAKALGCNWFILWGSVQWQPRGIINLATYLAEVKEVLDYCQKVGMYVLVYAGDFNGTNLSGSDFTPVSNANVITIETALAQLCAKYPNIIGFITMDEPLAGPVNYTSTLGSLLSAQYSAVKAVLPSDIGVCCAPNPCQNVLGSNVWNYSGVGATNLDSLAPYCDFLVFHPFYAASLADTSLLRAAYPNKDILMPSTVAEEVDGTSATICTAIMALVGANRFRGMGYFDSNDFILGGHTWRYGMFNDDMTSRATRTSAYAAGISGASYPQRSVRFRPGSPRVNQYLRWGFQ